MGRLFDNSGDRSRGRECEDLEGVRNRFLVCTMRTLSRGPVCNFARRSSFVGLDASCNMPAGAGADGALLEKLRAVRAFADLTKLPGRASLADELQRHCGGAEHLDAKFRRKRPAGHTHLIVGNPSVAELKVAWGAFLAGAQFDPDSTYSVDELKLPEKSPAATAAVAEPDSAVGALGGGVAATGAGDEGVPPAAAAGTGAAPIAPWMQAVWVRQVGLKLERWARSSAPSVLARHRHVRGDVDTECANAARTAFRGEVAALMQDAAGALFCRFNCNQLFNCMPEQLVGALPAEFDHYWQLGDEGECGPECGARGEVRTCRDLALAAARGVLGSVQFGVLQIRYETAGFRCTTSTLGWPMWWLGVGSFLQELGRMHEHVAASLGLSRDLFVQHIVGKLSAADLQSLAEAVERGVRKQVPQGMSPFENTRLHKRSRLQTSPGSGCDGGGRGKGAPRRQRVTARTASLQVERARKIIREDWMHEEGLKKVPSWGTVAGRRFVARVSIFVNKGWRGTIKLLKKVRRQERGRGDLDVSSDAGSDSDVSIDDD